jgi:hypothetical protein
LAVISCTATHAHATTCAPIIKSSAVSDSAPSSIFFQEREQYRPGHDVKRHQGQDLAASSCSVVSHGVQTNCFPKVYGKLAYIVPGLRPCALLPEHSTLLLELNSSQRPGRESHCIFVCARENHAPSNCFSSAGFAPGSKQAATSNSRPSISHLNRSYTTRSRSSSCRAKARPVKGPRCQTLKLQTRTS